VTNFKKVGFILLVPMLPAFLAAFYHSERLNNREPVEEEAEFREVMEWSDVLWVDARSEAQFQNAHMPGAVLLTEQRWEQQLADFLDRWRPGQQVVVYCGSTSCEASHGVARRLRQELGLEEIHVLKGGWEGIEKYGPLEGFPGETP